jgi:hypothetical protein
VISSELAKKKEGGLTTEQREITINFGMWEAIESLPKQQ